MIRILVAAGLTLSAGSALAQIGPSHTDNTASVSRGIGPTASSAPYDSVARPARHRDVDTTGTIVVPRPETQKVMGLPVPHSY